MTHGRTYSEQRYSQLDQINDSSVDRLGLAWHYDLDTNRGQQASPIVVDGVMYTTSAGSKVQALNARTGELLWQFDPEVPVAWDHKAWLRFSESRSRGLDGTGVRRHIGRPLDRA